MKIIDNMPILVIITAILANIAIGISNNVEFSVLMIRSIIVTIVFGILSYMLAKTIRSAVEFSRLSRFSGGKDEEAGLSEGQMGTENKSSFDIKVPPLADIELLNINNENDNDFVELNPVRLQGIFRSEQE
jgi:ribose/xylose/arabinose/galactoside ABC-type transport system permease subunit